MSNTVGGYTRTIALWVMIVCCAIADFILWSRWLVTHTIGVLFWATFWLLIPLIVIGYEIFAVLTNRKTISTMWKEWLLKEPIFAWSATVLLWIALNALFVHLIFW